MRQSVTESDLKLLHPTLQNTSVWAPQHCKPKWTVAIIIPFRERASQLRMFLANMIPMLQQQLIAFTIFVVDQVIIYVFLNDVDCFIIVKCFITTYIDQYPVQYQT